MVDVFSNIAMCGHQAPTILLQCQSVEGDEMTYETPKSSKFDGEVHPDSVAATKNDLTKLLVSKQLGSRGSLAPLVLILLKDFEVTRSRRG